MEGMSEAVFWELTPGAVTRFLKAKNARRKRDLQTEAAMLHTHANLIGASVGRLFSKGSKFPTVEESFPGIFDYDEETARTQRSINAFMRFAEHHNARSELNGNTGDNQR